MQGTDSQEIIELVDQSLQQNRRAQAELYRLYSRAMFNTCLRICGEYAEAEDALQESFCDAFRSLSSFSREVSFGAWLKRITVNRSINMMKRKKLQFASLDDFDQERLSGLEDKQEDPLEGDYDMQSVRKAIDALPEGYRVVFSLYAVEGYDHEEISGILGVTESTSKTQYHRAKKKMRALLQAMGS